MVKFKLVAAFLLAGLLLIVVMQNAESVETRVLLWTVTLPRLLLVLLSALFGFLLGLLVALRFSGSKTRSGD